MARLCFVGGKSKLGLRGGNSRGVMQPHSNGKEDGFATLRICRRHHRTKKHLYTLPLCIYFIFHSHVPPFSTSVNLFFFCFFFFFFLQLQIWKAVISKVINHLTLFKCMEHYLVQHLVKDPRIPESVNLFRLFEGSR